MWPPGRLRQVSPSRSAHLFLPFRVLPIRLSLTIQSDSLEKLVGQFRKTAVAVRCAMTVPVHLKCSLPRPGSSLVSGGVDRPFYP